MCLHIEYVFSLCTAAYLLGYVSAFAALVVLLVFLSFCPIKS